MKFNEWITHQIDRKDRVGTAAKISAELGGCPDRDAYEIEMWLWNHGKTLKTLGAFQTARREYAGWRKGERWAAMNTAHPRPAGRPKTSGLGFTCKWPSGACDRRHRELHQAFFCRCSSTQQNRSIRRYNGDRLSKEESKRVLGLMLKNPRMAAKFR